MNEEKQIEFVKSMENVTQKQLEVLLLFAPPPLGEGLKQVEIAQELGISVKAVEKRLNTFKKDFPTAYDRLWNFKKNYTKTKGKIENPVSLSEFGDDIAVGESITSDGKGPKIVRKF